MIEIITPKEVSGYQWLPGTNQYLGATFVDTKLQAVDEKNSTGVNFAVYSPEATALILCLFDEDGCETCLPMKKTPEGIWNLLIPDVRAGQCYGFRADGRWAPDEGLRFNRHKLLADPYARQVKGKVNWRGDVFDYSGKDRSNWTINTEDSKAVTPRSVVREDYFDWQGVESPARVDGAEVIYETHLKGFTKQHPDIPEHFRGTYLGMSHPVVIKYLQELGITTVELMPVTSFLSEARLNRLGLRNYWGYNPLCFMAPEPSYAIDDPVTEMKTMVRELHRAGIRVVMDVVYNHTCEAGADGPSFSLRGLAEKDYYLQDHQDGHLVHANYSGCGNTLNYDCPQTLKLLMDSLRHWVEQYHIDGFRFDLAPTMARRYRHFDANSAFFQAVHQDPVLSQIQMIAEPWDIGPDGYRLSGFPRTWQEWNDRYRDGIRAFWRGDREKVVDLAWRMTGSSDVFGEARPLGSINFICSHDGFTMKDLVSYERRHNLANGEDNRDGDAHNLSWNNGFEGRSDDPNVLNTRRKARRNLMTTLLMSRGTPMFLAGDEFGNGQHGNNNAYCQDNPVSWLDWNRFEKGGHGEQERTFVAGLISLRKRYPVLASIYEDSQGTSDRLVHDWFSKHGSRLSAAQLPEQNDGTLGIRFRCKDESLLSLIVLVNNSETQQRFHFLDVARNVRWNRILTTEGKDYFKREVVLNHGWYDVPNGSITVIEEQVIPKD